MKIIARTLIAVALLCGPASGQTADPLLLVDVDWLSQHLSDRDVVVLHVGTRTEYNAQHIPGARFVSRDEVAKPQDAARGDLTLELPAATDLRTTFAARGVSDDSRIVVYLGKDSDVQQATRIILTLDYLGLGNRTSLLNGGLGAWLRAGKPVTAEAPRATPGVLSARATKPVVVDAEFVKSLASRQNHKLIDARAPVFYTGVQPTNNKAGHIPGAANIPFTDVVDTELKMDRGRLAELFARAGVRPGDTVVAYCHIGSQATVVVFAARLLGHPVVLYDGSFQDWATANRGPVEK